MKLFDSEVVPAKALKRAKRSLTRLSETRVLLYSDSGSLNTGEHTREHTSEGAAKTGCQWPQRVA